MTSDVFRLVLASASPRRRELMALLDVPFKIIVPAVDEHVSPDDIPAEVPQRFSRRKAEAVAAQVSEGFVVAADTIVVHRGMILGKPLDADHAVEMLRRLRGERHRVLSGVTVMDASTSKQITELCETLVWMRAMDDAEIEAYVASGDPLDKAARLCHSERGFCAGRASGGLSGQCDGPADVSRGAGVTPPGNGVAAQRADALRHPLWLFVRAVRGRQSCDPGGGVMPARDRAEL